MPSRLSATVTALEASEWNHPELRFLVDGRDVVGEVFHEGPCEDPDRLLGAPSPLLPGEEPREVRLAEAGCTEGCCGAVYVRVRRENGYIVWDRWRNPDEDDLVQDEFRFDADQYEAELARAHHDRAREWTGRTVSRLVRGFLVANPDVLERWNSALASVESLPDSRDEIRGVFFSPPLKVVYEHEDDLGRLNEHAQFLLRVPVTEEPAPVQAERIRTMLAEGDPRASAEVVGGYTAPH